MDFVYFAKAFFSLKLL